MKRVALGAAIALMLASCGGSSGNGDADAKTAKECGFQPAEGEIDPDDAPELLFIEGAEITYLDVTKKDIIVAGSVPYDVEGALKRYRDKVESEGYELLSVDNEVFEAEIYLQDDDYVGAIRMGRSKCLERSFVNIGMRAN